MEPNAHGYILHNSLTGPAVGPLVSPQPTRHCGMVVLPHSHQRLDDEYSDRAERLRGGAMGCVCCGSTSAQDDGRSSLLEPSPVSSLTEKHTRVADERPLMVLPPRILEPPPVHLAYPTRPSAPPLRIIPSRKGSASVPAMHQTSPITKSCRSAQTCLGVGRYYESLWERPREQPMGFFLEPFGTSLSRYPIFLSPAQAHNVRFSGGPPAVTAPFVTGRR